MSESTVRFTSEAIQKTASSADVLCSQSFQAGASLALALAYAHGLNVDEMHDLSRSFAAPSTQEERENG